MWRGSSSISPMAMPDVGLPNEPEPQTVTPLSAAAATSREAWRMPGGMRSLRAGSFSITARGKAVRSRMAQTIWKPCSDFTTVSGPPRCSLNTLMSTSPVTFDQSATLRATFWKSSRIAQRYLAMWSGFLGCGGLGLKGQGGPHRKRETGRCRNGLQACKVGQGARRAAARTQCVTSGSGRLGRAVQHARHSAVQELTFASGLDADQCRDRIVLGGRRVMLGVPGRAGAAHVML